MTSFENIPSDELTLVIVNHGIIPSEVNGKPLLKMSVELHHEDKRLLDFQEYYPPTFADKLNELGLDIHCVLEDEWFSFEIDGCSYDLNIWIDDIRNQLDASIYPIVEDEHGPDTDCSQLIHRIANIKFN